MYGSTILRGLLHGGLLLAGGLTVGLGLSVSDRLQADHSPPPAVAANLEIARLNGAVDEMRGKLAVSELQIERLTAVMDYSSSYRIPADLAGTIYDAAVAEGLHPSLGFQLVKVESGFRSHARSSRGAVGLAQVRLATARGIEPGITERELARPGRNLRIGFRVLRRYLRQFDNDLELALRAYNLGPTGALASLVDTATTPGGAAYAGRVMQGVKGTGASRSGAPR